MFKGYLTYALATVAVIWAAAGYLMGWTDAATAMNVAWVGLAAFGIRRAVSSNGTGQ